MTCTVILVCGFNGFILFLCYTDCVVCAASVHWGCGNCYTSRTVLSTVWWVRSIGLNSSNILLCYLNIVDTVVCKNGDETYFPGETFKADCNTWYGIHSPLLYLMTYIVLILHHSTCTDSGLVACTEIACTGKIQLCRFIYFEVLY